MNNRHAKRILKSITKRIHRLSFVLFGQRYLQSQSNRSWAQADNSYRGSPEYYQLQEDRLVEALRLVSGERNSAIDIGCSDGHFTFIISQFYKVTKGVDISKHLIGQAIETAGNSHETANVTFDVLDLTRDFPNGRYDLVSCMGVTSAIMDDDRFRDFLSKLVAIVETGGYLIMKDSVSPNMEWFNITNNYFAKYRNEDYYFTELANLNLVTIAKFELSRHNNKRNYLCLLQKPAT